MKNQRNLSVRMQKNSKKNSNYFIKKSNPNLKNSTEKVMETMKYKMIFMNLSQTDFRKTKTQLS